jgi:hypothetical protein
LTEVAIERHVFVVMTQASFAGSPESHAPKSTPPPLPESATRLSPKVAAEEEAFADVMLERLASSDYAGALIAAEAFLEHHPRDPDATACAQMARSELRKLYVARLGSLARVPHVAMSPEGLLALPSVDFHAGFLLSRIDGLSTLDEIASSGGMPPLNALRILSELYLHRAIAFDD